MKNQKVIYHVKQQENSFRKNMMIEKNTTALIVHGYGLGHSDWDSVMWGNTKYGLLGRAPTGILIAHRRQPALIIWNTGATEKDGLQEGDYIFQYTLEHLDNLPNQFSEFQSVDIEELAAYLRRVSTTEIESKRTSESLINAIPQLTENGCVLYTEVIQVTSKNHASRVLRDSIALWWEERGLLIPTSIYPAQTGYSGGTAGDVQVTDLAPDKQTAHDAERATGLRR